MPLFEAQPRFIFESPAGKAEPFRHVRRQSRAARFFPEVESGQLSDPLRLIR
jgi:hypothetical protein